MSAGVIGKHHLGDAIAEFERGLERFGQALRGIGAHAEAIHDHLDGVALLGVELGYRVDLVHGAVDAHAHEALAGKLGDQRRVLALAGIHQRRQQQRQFALGREQRLIDHLAHCLRRQVDAVVRTARQSRARVQQPQVVVDLGHRAHG